MEKGKEKHTFQANYNKYILYYTKEQKAKIDYMQGWKSTINWLKWYIKSGKLESGTHKKLCNTCYVASAINNYCFSILQQDENTFLIIDSI